MQEWLTGIDPGLRFRLRLRYGGQVAPSGLRLPASGRGGANPDDIVPGSLKRRHGAAGDIFIRARSAKVGTGFASDHALTL